MSHELTFTNGNAEMAYYGEKPWHKLGTQVAAAMTAAEAIEAARLGWNVKKSPVFYERMNGQQGATDRFAVVRTDNDACLGVVGNVYRPLQNREAFSFFDAIVGQKLAVYHTAGSILGGRKIWMLAKLPGSCWITPEDNVEKYLLLSNSHDGTSSVSIAVTPIRVVCQNTLNMALHSDVKTRVKHTMAMGQGIDSIRKQLGIADAYFQTFEEVGKALVNKQANSAMVERLLSDLGLSLEDSKESSRIENIRYDIMGKFEHGKGNNMRSVRGSAWALLNGVVEYVDYSRSTKTHDGHSVSDSRTNSILFGSGAAMKQKALDCLVSY